MKGFKLFFPIFFLTAAVFLAYAPMLSHVSFTDGNQLDYLFERHDRTSLKEGLAFSDFNLATAHGKGDEALYRPFLFIWLALLAKLSPYQYFYWNISHLFLHLFVVVQLFRILREIQADTAAFFLALLFSALSVNRYLAANVHLGGYLISFGLLLEAMIQMKRSLSAGGNGSLLIYGLALGAAAFFYEVSFFAGLLLSLYGAFMLRKQGDPKQSRKSFFLFIPCFIYFIFYFHHLREAPRLFYTASTASPSCLLSFKNIRNSFSCIPQTLIERIRELFIFDLTKPVAYFKWRLFFCTAGLVCLCKISWKHLKVNASWILLFCGIMLSYTALGCFGRGLDTLPYYTYFFALILFLLFYSCIDWQSLSRSRKNLLSVLFLCLCAVQGFDVYQSTSAHDANEVLARRYYSELSRFVMRHRRENQFSFKVCNPPENYDPMIPFHMGYPDDSSAIVIQKTRAEVIYAPFYKIENPEYSLTWQSSKQSFQIEKYCL